MPQIAAERGTLTRRANSVDLARDIFERDLMIIIDSPQTLIMSLYYPFPAAYSRPNEYQRQGCVNRVLFKRNKYREKAGECFLIGNHFHALMGVYLSRVARAWIVDLYRVISLSPLAQE